MDKPPANLQPHLNSFEELTKRSETAPFAISRW